MSKTLSLVRHIYSPVATLGYLFVDDVRLCTLEEPWRPDPDGVGGQRREGGLAESCVPDGLYQLCPHNGTLRKDVWKLHNPSLGVYGTSSPPLGQKFGRSGILIHSGNTTEDILGCILVGLAHGEMNGRAAVLNSQAALAKLRSVVNRTDIHRLVIRPTAGTIELPL